METLRHPILAKTNHCMFSNILNFLCVAFGFIWVFPYSKLRYGLLRVHSLRAPSHSTLKKKRRKGRKKEKEKGRKKKEEKKIRYEVSSCCLGPVDSFDRDAIITKGKTLVKKYF